MNKLVTNYGKETEFTMVLLPMPDYQLCGQYGDLRNISGTSLKLYEYP